MTEFIIPTPDDYARAVAKIDAGYMERGITTVEGVSKAVSKMPHNVTDWSKAVAYWMNPMDRTTGEDMYEQQPLTLAVGLGVAAGRLLVAEAFPSDVVNLSHITKSKIGVEDTGSEDRAEEIHAYAGDLINLGERGLMYIGTVAVGWVEAIEDACVPDLRLRPYVRRGSGLVVALAHEVVIAKAAAAHFSELESLEKQLALLDGGADPWDAALKNL